MLLRARATPSGSQLSALSDREHTVLVLMAEGLTNRAIADRMAISVRTVESHVNSVFTKLGLASDDVEHRRVMAVLEYLRVRTPAARSDYSPLGAQPGAARSVVAERAARDTSERVPRGSRNNRRSFPR